MIISVTNSKNTTSQLDPNGVLSLVEGQKVLFDIPDLPKGASVNIQDVSGPVLKTIKGGADVPYYFIPYAGLKKIQFQVRLHGENYFIQQYKVSVLSVNNPNVDPTPPVINPTPVNPVPVPVNPTPVVTYPLKFGYCSLTSAMKDLVAPLNPASNRLWINTTDFKNYKTDSDIQGGFNVYKLTGAKPAFMCGQNYTTVGMLNNASDWFMSFVKDAIRIADADPKTKDIIIDVRVMNEPDWTYFQNGDVATYVKNGLAPVYKTLKAEFKDRVRVVGGNLSFDYDLLVKNIDGLASNSDAIGYHGYAKSRAELNRYDVVAKACHAVNKPLVLDEFGLGYGGVIRDALKQGNTDKAKQYTDAWPTDVTYTIEYVAKLGIEEACFYTSLNTNNSTNAGQAIFSQSNGVLSKTVFYDAVMQGLNNINYFGS